MFEEIECLVANGRWEEASCACKALLELHPENAKAHAYLGLSRYRLDDLEGAAVELQRACYLDPDRVDVGVKLAQALYRLHRHKDALEVVRKYLHLRPADHTLLGLQECLLEMDDAVEHDAWERTTRLEVVHVAVVED